MKKRRITSILILAVLLLSSCNLPSSKPSGETSPGAVFTAAAKTVEAKLTQNAELNASRASATIEFPTNLPISTPTIIQQTATPAATNPPQVIPTKSCDAAQFIQDVTINDGSIIPAGSAFIKTWRLKNIGACTWTTSYSLVFDSGDLMGGTKIQNLSAEVTPGNSIDISVSLIAPESAGSYRGFWGISNGVGTRLPVIGGAAGQSFYVDIKVQAGVGVTVTPGSDGFSVTDVGFSVVHTGDCNAANSNYVITAQITVNNPGVVNFTWIRSDNSTSPDNSGTLSFSAAGTKQISYTWVTTLTNIWMDLFIDQPNNQQFGRAALNCP